MVARVARRSNPVDSGTLVPCGVAGLVRGARAGDAAALDALLARISARVWSIAYHMLGDEHEADDARQDTFVAVQVGLAKLTDPAAFEGWAMRIARNVAVDHARRMARCRPSPRAHDEDADHDQELPQVLRRSGAAETSPAAQLLLREAFQGLPEAVRETVRLRYADGRTCKEIARIQGLGTSCVKTRLHRARRRLTEAAAAGRWRPV